MPRFDGDARCEYKRLFSIIMLFRSFPGGFLVFGRGGGYVPPSTAQIYHPNRKMDPGFPIYTENKSAYGAATENKQPEHPT